MKYNTYTAHITDGVFLVFGQLPTNGDRRGSHSQTRRLDGVQQRC